MLKILQAGLQQYVNRELQIFKLNLEKEEEPETKLPTSIGITEEAREFQKNIDFCFIDYAKAFDCVDHNNLWKILKELAAVPGSCFGAEGYIRLSCCNSDEELEEGLNRLESFIRRLLP